MCEKYLKRVAKVKKGFFTADPHARQFLAWLIESGGPYLSLIVGMKHFSYRALW
jgi:hypothetical protein